MREILAPDEFNFPTFTYQRFLFLAGSIEMGTAEEWQQKVVTGLSDTIWTILNPRRKDWDSSWVQSIENPQFREQVEWELDALNHADAVLFYFDPNTKSPVTMLELGYMAKQRETEIVVVCPDGFWRKGNIDILCEREIMFQLPTLDKAISYLKTRDIV